MNIVSTLVGITIMGAAAPSVLTMTLAPVEAQKRASNFSIAESKAVSYAAANDGQVSKQAAIPDGCIETDEGSGAWDVECKEGKGRFKQIVTRSYRLIAPSGGYNNPTRSFAFDTPSSFGHDNCYSTDPWGIIWTNEHRAAGHLGACIPEPLQSRANYLASDPGDWLFDISDYGYGSHPEF
jgi:hypothetical protein